MEALGRWVNRARGRGGARGPGPPSALRPFFDLDYLVCNKTMRFTVNGFGSFLARSFGEAEDLTCIFVVPTSVVLDSMLLLGLQVLPVRLSYRLYRQATLHQAPALRSCERVDK